MTDFSQAFLKLSKFVRVLLARRGQHPETIAPERIATMGDEFTEHDLETPTEHDLDEAYGSRFLGVVDIGDKKIRTKILKVRKEEVKDRDTNRMKKRFVAFFEGIDKPLVLNVTNKNVLVDALGKAPANWLNASVGILVDPSVGFGNKKTGGVRLRVLGPAIMPKSATKPAENPAAKSTPPTADDGDPGFDPEFDAMVPDLSAG
jgi:hypothetical protein